MVAGTRLLHCRRKKRCRGRSTGPLATSHIYTSVLLYAFSRNQPATVASNDEGSGEPSIQTRRQERRSGSHSHSTCSYHTH